MNDCPHIRIGWFHRCKDCKKHITIELLQELTEKNRQEKEILTRLLEKKSMSKFNNTWGGK